MWRRLSSRTVRRMPRQWLLRRSLLGHPGCSCARTGSGCSWTMRRSRPASCLQWHGRLLDGLQLARDKLLQDLLAQERPPHGGLSYSRSSLGPLSFASAPVRGKQSTHHLTLKIIGERPAARSDKVCNFSFGLLLTRLLHGVEKSVEGPPQDADPVHRHIPPRRVANVSG